jgi:hypothetical protein
MNVRLVVAFTAIFAFASFSAVDGARRKPKVDEVLEGEGCDKVET